MRNHKRILVILWLASLVLVLTGCFIQPDRTLDPLAVNSEGQLPFNTLEPTQYGAVSPTPSPEAAPLATASGEMSGQWESWGGGGSATAAPAGAGTSAPTGTTWQTSTEDYNAGYPVLRVGSTGNDVYDMQERLKELGYYTGALDGKFASGTQDAVMAFQTANGLTADGVAGRATQDKLYSASAQKKVISVSSGSGSSSGSSSSGSSSSSNGSSSSGSGVLKNGSSGLEVRKVQVRLAELGYYNGGADGIYGSTTEAAVKAFQRNNNLTGDGQAGSATQGKLWSNDAKAAAKPVTTADPNATRSLRLGMEGNDVYSMQKRLVELGYLSGVPDAAFGAETETALVAFQRNNGLTADGVAGNSTISKLNSNSAKKAASVSATPTPAPGSYTVLKEGDSGTYVYDMQERLYALGYYTGRIDGRFGAGTTAAVRAFQQASGLTVDGVAGASTQRTLFSSGAVTSAGAGSGTAQSTPAPSTPDTGATYTLLKLGSTGDDVLRLQRYLMDLGFYNGRVDGSYGSLLTAAVQMFQRVNGLTQDGVAGQSTQALLYSGHAAGLPDAEVTAAPDMTQVLQYGSTGLAVQQLNQRLFELFYLEENQISNEFKQSTVDAVKKFQEAHQLKVDGAAGPETLQAIYDKDATALPNIAQ